MLINSISPVSMCGKTPLPIMDNLGRVFEVNAENDLRIFSQRGLPPNITEVRMEALSEKELPLFFENALGRDLVSLENVVVPAASKLLDIII